MGSNLSIRKQLIIIIMLAATLSSMAGYAIFISWYLQNQHTQLLDYSRTVADVLGQDFARMVVLNDVSVAADVSAKLTGFPQVQMIVLYEQATEQAVYQFRTPALTSEIIPLLPDEESRYAHGVEGDLVLYLPAYYRGIELGTIYFRMHQLSLLDVLKRDIMAMLGIGVFSLLVAFVLALRFESGFNAPILRLVRFLQQISHTSGENERIKLAEQNELGKVYQAVNGMLDRIDASNEQLKLAAVAFDTQDGITITDSETRILKVNHAFTRITGYTQQEVLGKTPAVLKSGRQAPLFYRQMWQTLKQHGRWSGEIWNRNKFGEVYPEWLSVQAVYDESGVLTHYVGIFTDLTHVKSVEQQIDYLGKYDPLTGLANRNLLTRRLQESLLRLQAEGRTGAVLCLDLDDFKLINDAYGHELGDKTLLELSTRLRDVFGDDTILARLGGDVFVVVQEHLDTDRNRATLELESLLVRMVGVLEQPYDMADETHGFTTSIGIMFYPAPEIDAAALINQAELALHLAKRSSFEKWHYYEPEAERLARHYIDRQRELKRAIVEEEFVLYYQTQHNRHGKVVAVEALVRWQHPKEGLLGPYEIIPIAEQSGLIISIGAWVIRTACRQLARWQSDPCARHWSISVNVSPRQFEQEDCVSRIAKMLKETGAPPHLLKVELTESILMENRDNTIRKMHALRELGLQLSLDDFGTGYSSLLYLKQLPFTQVKIDQGFVSNMTTSMGDVAIIKSILSLGEAFGMDVVAEGVETEKHLRQLEDMGCGIFQGYYFSRPQPAEAVQEIYQGSGLARPE